MAALIRFGLAKDDRCMNIAVAPDAGVFDGQGWQAVIDIDDLPVSIGDDYDPATQTFSPHKPDTLAAAKAGKFAAIDAKTDALFQQGFIYQDQVFSLSMEAQVNLARMQQFDTLLPYPVTYPTMDDTSKITLPDAAAVDQFVGGGVAAVAYILIVANKIKDLVRAATTIAEVEAIVDPR